MSCEVKTKRKAKLWRICIKTVIRTIVLLKPSRSEHLSNTLCSTETIKLNWYKEKDCDSNSLLRKIFKFWNRRREYLAKTYESRLLEHSTQTKDTKTMKMEWRLNWIHSFGSVWFDLVHFSNPCVEVVILVDDNEPNQTNLRLIYN